MSELDRMMGGLRCRDVLGVLGDYVDGELPERVAGKVEAHLRGCDRCEKFGGEYASVVRALRRNLLGPGDDAAPLRGLAERMKSVWADESE